MAINGCLSRFMFTAALALILVPAQYFVPDLYSGVEDNLIPVPQPAPALHKPAWFDIAFILLSPIDLFLSVFLLVAVLIIYLCEWLQRKLLERRILKLNKYLSASVARLHTWDEQQEELEATLKMVQNATSEYNLMLFLLLRQHRCITSPNSPPSNCFFDKELDDDLAFLRNPTISS